MWEGDAGRRERGGDAGWEGTRGRIVDAACVQ